MRRRLPVSKLAAGLSLILLLSPALARACAVCGGGPDRMRTAFLISTIFLSLLPLALIFSGVWWLRRRLGTALREEFAERDDPAPAMRVEPAPEAPPLHSAEVAPSR